MGQGRVFLGADSVPKAPHTLLPQRPKPCALSLTDFLFSRRSPQTPSLLLNLWDMWNAGFCQHPQFIVPTFRAKAHSHFQLVQRPAILF